MADEPTVMERPEQPYAAITAEVTMQEIGDVLPPLVGEVYDWLGSNDLEGSGMPFWKYNVIDMAAHLEVEVGVPVAHPVSGDERVHGGVLPAGRYAVAFHIGHPDTLERATAELLAWGEKQGVRWDVVTTGGEERWVARLEEYLNGPDDQPDMHKWETNLVFKLAE